MKLKVPVTRLGVSVQLWQGPWPHTVVTLWWGLRPRHWRLRVYHWRGRLVR